MRVDVQNSRLGWYTNWFLLVSLGGVLCAHKGIFDTSITDNKNVLCALLNKTYVFHLFGLQAHLGPKELNVDP